MRVRVRVSGSEERKKEKKKRGGPSRELIAVFYVQNPRILQTLSHFGGTETLFFFRHRLPFCAHTKKAEREKKGRGEKEKAKMGWDTNIQGPACASLALELHKQKKNEKEEKRQREESLLIHITHDSRTETQTQNVIANSQFGMLFWSWNRVQYGRENWVWMVTCIY